MTQARGPFGGSDPAPESSWSALARLVWGDVTAKTTSRDASLIRRRRDLHPDAPPRAPLFASRDLPVPESASPEGSRAGRLRPTYLLQAVALARATSRPSLRPAPSPAPEPMSDDEILRILASTPRRSPIIASANTRLASAMKLPLIEGADLSTLASRFEQSLSRREDAIKAEEARQTNAGRLPPLAAVPTLASDAGQSVKPIPPQPVQNDSKAPPSLMGTDALSIALATLRALALQSRR